MKYVEAPDEYTGPNRSIFLAGGISNCPNWQQQIAEGLTYTDLIVYNPRRDNFPMGNLVEGKKQIRWEWKYLQEADYISFWFPKETLCPITLFELGSWSMSDKKLFVGVHLDYARRFDVEEQLKLRRPDVEIVYDLFRLLRQIIEYEYSQDEKETNDL